jgi:predicted permease
MVSTLVQDLTFAFRQLQKNPGRMLVAVAVLALGLGANAAIFSVVDAVLLQPLPYPDPDRLAGLYERDVIGEEPYNSVAPANYLDWRRQAHQFQEIAASGEDRFNLSSPSNDFVPERVDGSFISDNLLTALGVHPQIGRNFRGAEDRPGAVRVALISYGLWQRRFGGSSDVLARQIRLDSEDYQIIGVMPRSFVYPSRDTQVWVPLEQHLPPKQLANHENHYLDVIGRLRPGATVEEGRTEIDGLVKQYKSANPKAVMGKGGNAVPLAYVAVRDVKTSLLVLFGAVVCILIIACVNVANLLLAQALGRQREVAIRAAVGASRSRIVAQLLTESVLLSVIGGLAGLLIASFTTGYLAVKAPNAAYLPQADRIGMDYRVFLFTFAIALVTGIAAGLYPAVQAARSDLINHLKESARSSTPGRSHARFRDVLVAAEVALSLMVLVAAGLLLRSFDQLRHVQTGVRTDHTLTVGISLSEAAYPKKTDVGNFYRNLEQAAAALPGVESAGLTTCPPAGGHCSDWVFNIEGRVLPPGVLLDALFRMVDPGFFQAAGIPLLRGRGFTDRDVAGLDEKNPRPGCIIISESLAKTYFPNEDPIGKHILLGGPDVPGRVEIIGLVGDVLKRPDAKIEPTYYLPILDGDRRQAYLVLHTAVEPHSVISEVRMAIQRMDRDMPLAQVRTTGEIIGSSAERREFSLTLLSLFAGLALLLAAVGLYGVLSYTVSQRAGEMGIRIALGAGAGEVRRMILLQGMRPALAGVAAGIVGALFATRLLGSMLFEVNAIDPATFGAVTLVLLGVASLACLVPAVRATRIDPTLALRGE